jgi:hypothetical protein
VTVHAFYWLLGVLLDPENGSSTFLRNTGERLPGYMASYLGLWYALQCIKLPTDKQAYYDVLDLISEPLTDHGLFN